MYPTPDMIYYKIGAAVRTNAKKLPEHKKGDRR